MVADRTPRMSVAEYQIMFSLKLYVLQLTFLSLSPQIAEQKTFLIYLLLIDHFGLSRMLHGGHLVFSHKGSTQF